jgi:predicted transcriptional regulator
MTPNDFLKIIQQEISPVDEIPNGWHSIEQLSEMWNLSRSHTNRRILDGKKCGYVSEKKFRVKDSRRKNPYYSFHEKENNQKDNKRKVMEDTIRSCGKNKRSR